MVAQMHFLLLDAPVAAKCRPESQFIVEAILNIPRAEGLFCLGFSGCPSYYSSAMAFQTVSAMFLSVAAENAFGDFARLAARPRVRLSIASGGRSLRIPPFLFGCI